MATLYCLSCFFELPEDTLPDGHATKITCPQCHGSQFTTRPDWPKALTHNDKRFLKSLRISKG